MKRRLLTLIMAAALVLSMLSACGGNNGNNGNNGNSGNTSSNTNQQQNQAQQPDDSQPNVEPGEPVYGGTLKVTINSDPTTLDALYATNADSQVPMSHIYETALAADTGGGTWPGVCDYTYENNVLTLTVREGVTFHNGDAVTIDDVYASAQRWLALSSAAKKQVGPKLASMEVVDDALVLTFGEVAPLALIAITGYDGGLYIFPASICEKYGEDQIC